MEFVLPPVRLSWKRLGDAYVISFFMYCIDVAVRDELDRLLLRA